MPPKKVNKTVKKTGQINTPRRRIKKEKCSSITETGESTKNPQPNNSTRIKDGDQNKDRVVILNKNDINIMLANEVVGRQFPKKSTLLKEPVNKAVLDLLNKSKSKPVLKRKRPLKNNIVLNGDTLTCVDEAAKNNGRRRIQPRKFRNSTMMTKKCVSPDVTNESVLSPVKNVTKRIRKNKAAPKQDPVENNFTTEKSPGAVKPKTTRRKLSLNRKSAAGEPRTRKKSRYSKEIEPEVTPESITASQKENNEIVDTSNVCKEQHIVLRRNSFASLSELSWTKDISSSSNTTFATVSSNDFFRIDNKIPIIKLTNIDLKLKGEENNNICNVGDKLRPTQTITIQFDNSLCEKSAIETSNKWNAKNVQDEVDGPFVSNLSSSTSESCSDLEKSGQITPAGRNKLNDTLEKLSSKLKSFDLEIINWIGYTNETVNPNVEKIHEKLREYNFLKEEMNVIVHSKNIIRILSGNNQSTETENEPVMTSENLQTTVENTLNAKSSQSQSINYVSDDKHNSSEEKDSREQSKIAQIEPSKEIDITINKSTDNISFDDDEDDALSLYAESITGIESSANNSKVDCNEECPNFDEYVPQSLPTQQPPKKITYQPTKIVLNKQVEHSDDGISNVCEKQNADSTSVYREQENDNILEENNMIYEDRLGDFEEMSRIQNSVTKLIKQVPVLMGSIYKPMTAATSVVFKGVCFYNLISNCKKNGCKYPHIPLEVEGVKRTLKKISDTTFIQEYMLLRAWPGLRWKYGIHFVEECIQRKLTKIVVEIALDFITKVTNKVTMTDVVENILLYLNNVDLCVCEDLLKYKIQSKNMLLCDFFISTIAESQNFSRFKTVFINLTEFMHRIGRTFCQGVAVQVLERVVILPYDEGLARALLKIIRNTKTSIFSNSMIGNLEQQLASMNTELYEEFCSLKNQALKSQLILGNCYTNPTHQNKDVDRPNINLNHIDKNKRYSPDTTNLDHLNMTAVEPKFTRTIDLNKLDYLNVNGRTNSSSSDSCEDKRFIPKSTHFKNWRGRKSFRANNNQINMRHMQRNQIMRPPLRPPFKRRFDQTFGGSPNKFQRRNGSNFFNDFS